MNKEQKNVAIEEITTDIQESEAIFVVDYRGMTVPQAAELRAKLREADTSLRVVKNTLTKRAAAAAGTEDLNEFLVGPTAIAFVRGDAALAAKELAAAQKAFEILDFKGGTMSGRAISVDEIKALAKLPSRQVLIGQLVGLTAAPLSGVVRTLGGFIGGFASQLGQIRDQGLVGGDAPAEEPAAEEAPAEEAAAEETPAEEPAAEVEADAPATEDSPAEEAAAEEAPADDAGDGEPAEEETPAAEEAPEETASADDAAEAGDESADNDDDGDGSEEAATE